MSLLSQASLKKLLVYVCCEREGTSRVDTEATSAQVIVSHNETLILYMHLPIADIADTSCRPASMAVCEHLPHPPIWKL